ncbi:DUF1684 domain-containing protein [soil metagenome]
MAASTATESLIEFRSARRKEVAAPRGPVSYYWGDFITEADQHVDGAPGVWSLLEGGRPGLVVRANAEAGIRIGGVAVDGTATLYADESYGQTIAEFPDGAQGVAFTPDGSRYMLRVWNQHSAWAQRFDDISTFDEDPSWVVEATVTRSNGGRTLSINRTRSPHAVDTAVVATLEFVRDGRAYRLDATVPGPEQDRVLVHFRDATSGMESYGAGRSLWFDAATLAEAKTIVLDFNRANLMPCAFSKAWNCPLPPPGNTLPIPVRAGEQHAVDAEGQPLL